MMDWDCYTVASERSTALRIACCLHRVEVVKLLLDAGVFVAHGGDQSILDDAARRAPASFYIRQQSDGQPHFIALGILHILVKKGGDLGEAKTVTITPLAAAASALVWKKKLCMAPTLTNLTHTHTHPITHTLSLPLSSSYFFSSL